MDLIFVGVAGVYNFVQIQKVAPNGTMQQMGPTYLLNLKYCLLLLISVTT
jgi:hypothetical protein